MLGENQIRRRRFVVYGEEDIVPGDVGALLEGLFGSTVIVTPVPHRPRALEIVPDIAPPTLDDPIADAILEPEDPIASDVVELEIPKGIHFILCRQTSEWDVGASVRDIVRGTLEEAEACARGWKSRFPLQHFGVAPLVSEARATSNPVETVRLQ